MKRYEIRKKCSSEWSGDNNKNIQRQEYLP